MYDREMWTGRAHDSYYFKGPRDNRVQGYDALAHNDAFDYFILFC